VSCGYYLFGDPASNEAGMKSDLEYLRSIDEGLARNTRAVEVNGEALTMIKRVAIWFLVLSILGLVLGFIAVALR
jgi:hypothetical protein